MDWQSIETAPRDGTEVLGFWSYVYIEDTGPTIGMSVVSWEKHDFGEGWTDGDGLANAGVYTHWMPLPEPPKATPSTTPELPSS